MGRTAILLFGLSQRIEIEEAREMSVLKIVVVKMGGGWVKGLLPHRDETVFGCDEFQLSRRLRQLKIREFVLIGRREKAR
ncbi:MAG: hypothetical protein WBF09_08895 [Candidatus Acidiferrum sp.]